MNDTETDNMNIICVEVPKQQTHILVQVIIQQNPCSKWLDKKLRDVPNYDIALLHTAYMWFKKLHFTHLILIPS